jgi:predicted transcriptional regulator
MNSPLHALVIGESGSGKSHIVNAIASLMPQEDVLSITRVSSKSLYHYSNDELVHKVLLIQDFEGLNEEAEYAFRELQSAGSITSSTTSKDKQGNLQAQIKTVRAHFSSLSASTKELYFDNMSRSIVIGIDESIEQTQRIINYQNKVIAGRVDMQEVNHARLLLQDCIRSLKQEDVINPYAEKIHLPIEAKMQRRLNIQYQSIVKAVTLLHQFQRKKDEQGRLLCEIQDLQTACDLLFPAILLKVDDLDSSLRQFFDNLKAHIKTTNTQFSQLDIRKALHTSKTQCFRYMTDLERLGYIQKVGGHQNKGYKYKIVYFDDMNLVKEKIKKELNEQIHQLKKS